MPLPYGSYFPLPDGSFVVTIVCPNEYSRQRLLCAADLIIPEAGEPPKPPTEEQVAAYLDRQDEDASTAHLKAGEAERAS